MAETPAKPLSGRAGILLVIGAVACFHIAYSTPLSFFIFGYVLCLVWLTRLRTMRLAFYAGLVVGLLCFAPQLLFFWGIFRQVAIVLWVILALWIALFVALGSAAFNRLGITWSTLLIPFLWTGLEYYRSELYYLRFSWLNVGYAFGNFQCLGVYGMGFFSVLAAACILAGRWKWLLLMAVVASGLLMLTPAISRLTSLRKVQVTGVQMEFPSQQEVLANLEKALARHPDTQLLVLSEYTFETPIPAGIMEWCRSNKKYLIIGGIDPVHGGHYYNTAFVIGPDGTIVFKQAKSVPIQFFADGLPAAEQNVWDSPWGKIGICICYDLSYTRVTDTLIRKGAQALIVPTMDVVGWGRHEHALHERIAPVRAAEYNVPIFRVASSGVSQLVTRGGVETATASFPGAGEIISGQMDIYSNFASLPVDRVLAPVCVAVTALFILWLPFTALARIILRSRKPEPVMEL